MMQVLARESSAVALLLLLAACSGDSLRNAGGQAQELATRYSESQIKAKIARMKSELRNMETAAEGFKADHGVFPKDWEELNKGIGFKAERDDSVSYQRVSTDGYRVSFTTRGVGTCEVEVGSAADQSMDGVISCKRDGDQ